MKETSDNKVEQATAQEQSQNTVPPTQNDQPTKTCVLESVRTAVEQGARHAQEAAKEMVPKVKTAAAGAAYWLGYGLTYAVVFSAVAVKELTPAVFISGCRDGAQAGRSSAERLTANLRSKPADAPSPEAAMTAPQTQPSSA